jgi:hypothetical protein
MNATTTASSTESALTTTVGGRPHRAPPKNTAVNANSISMIGIPITTWHRPSPQTSPSAAPGARRHIPTANAMANACAKPSTRPPVIAHVRTASVKPIASTMSAATASGNHGRQPVSLIRSSRWVGACHRKGRA